MRYFVDFHNHGDHTHFDFHPVKKELPHTPNHKGGNNSSCSHDHHGGSSSSCGHDHHEEENETHCCLSEDDEGCPCCAKAIDLDEVATALNEVNSNRNHNAHHHDDFAQFANLSSASHWGIFLGISGPLSLIGLTAAYRNIKGTIDNKNKLNKVINGLEKDIQNYRDKKNQSSGKNKKNYEDIIDRLEAFKSTLNYSKFDTEFNLVVPGAINGAASLAVLSTAILISPLALPIIGLYAACQTIRNGYDLIRNWNKILPKTYQNESKVTFLPGINKINQITNSKRNFYAVNTAGFAIFSAGATIATLAAFSVLNVVYMYIGISILALGALITGYTNNIWTNKFRPRNGALDIDRKQLNIKTIIEKIGEARSSKKLLKNYRDKFLTKNISEQFGYSLMASFPMLDKYGADKLHQLNKQRAFQSNATDEDRLDLIERLLNIKKLSFRKTNQDKETLISQLFDFKIISSNDMFNFDLISISRNKDKICKNIYDNLIRLNLDKSFLIKFVENYILNKQNIHDTSIKNQDQLIQKLEHSQLFKIKTIDTKKTIELRIDLIEKNPNAKRIFLTSLEEYLLFDKLKEYEYQQYAYNDYYWALKQQNPRDLSEENIEIDCYHDHPDDNSKQDDHEFCNHNHFDDKENHDGIAPQDVSETFTYSDAGCQDGHHDHIGCQSNNHDHAGCWDGQYDHVVEQRQRNSQDGGKCCNHSQDGQYDHVSFRSIGDDYQHADQRRNNSQDYEKYFNHTHAGSQDRHHNHVFEQRQNNRQDEAARARAREIARLEEEAKARRKAEQEAAILKTEQAKQEAARLKTEQEAARLKTEQEAARLKAEEEAEQEAKARREEKKEPENQTHVDPMQLPGGFAKRRCECHPKII